MHEMHYSETVYTGVHGHSAVCSPVSCLVGTCHISCMKYGCQSVIDLLITIPLLLLVLLQFY